MSSTRLAVQWLVLLAATGLMLWLETPSGAVRFEAFTRSFESEDVTARRRDSVAAVARARAEGIARGDSITAAAFAQPTSALPPEPARGTLSVPAPLVLGGFALVLLWRTVEWWQERARRRQL